MDRATRYLLDAQNREGYWWAELEADTGRRLDRIAAAFAVAEPGALPGKRVRDLTSDANLRLARSTPCNPPAYEFDSPLRG